MSAKADTEINKTTLAKIIFSWVSQRFGGSINLNIHYHILALDGAYTFHGEGHGDWARFHGTSAPSQIELIDILRKIISRVLRYIEKVRLIVKDAAAWDSCTATACRCQDVTYLKLDDHDSGFDKLVPIGENWG